ncbi:unnamed protein product [Amoebophrya sp. A25]|nr:unnamed protein product [Amoebophrya sp. A25]|eukprot:GSA25T00020088001.1
MSSLLEHLLDREVRVKIRDGRVLYARLWCVDSSESVILMDTVEHADLRSPSTTTSGGKEVLVDDAGEEDEALRLAEKVSPTRSSVPGEQIPEMKGNMTQRKIGLVMVRGEDIVSFSALSSDLDNARAELDPTSKKNPWRTMAAGLVRADETESSRGPAEAC